MLNATASSDINSCTEGLNQLLVYLILFKPSVQLLNEWKKWGKPKRLLANQILVNIHNRTK